MVQPDRTNSVDEGGEFQKHFILRTGLSYNRRRLFQLEKQHISGSLYACNSKPGFHLEKKPHNEGQLINLGARFMIDEPLAGYLQLNASSGTNERGTNLNGLLFTSGLEKPLLKRGLLRTSVMFSSGPQYTTYGRLLSYGYTAMKGETVGGLVYSQLLQVRPANFLSEKSDNLELFNLRQASGLAAANIAYHYGVFKNVKVTASVWLYRDSSNFKLADNSWKERFRGFESDLQLQYENQFITMYLKSGVFLPGPYYSDLVLSINQGPVIALVIGMTYQLKSGS